MSMHRITFPLKSDFDIFFQLKSADVESASFKFYRKYLIYFFI